MKTSVHKNTEGGKRAWILPAGIAFWPSHIQALFLTSPMSNATLLGAWMSGFKSTKLNQEENFVPSITSEEEVHEEVSKLKQEVVQLEEQQSQWKSAINNLTKLLSNSANSLSGDINSKIHEWISQQSEKLGLSNKIPELPKATLSDHPFPHRIQTGMLIFYHSALTYV